MSVLSKFMKKIEDQAPLIGGLLELGAPPAVKKAMDIMNMALGVKNESEVVRALQTDPEAYNKLKQAEMQHEVELKKLLVDETRTYLLDVQSARAREIEFSKATGGKRDWVQAIVGITIVASFVMSVFLPYFISIPSGSEVLMGRTQGVLGTLAITVVAYYYGTSKGSADKTAMINNMKTGGSV